MSFLYNNKTSQTIQMLYTLWLALATLLILSLTTSLLLQLLDPLFAVEHHKITNQPNGIALILALIGAILFSYPLLMFLTRDFLVNDFIPLLKCRLFWLAISIIVGIMIGVGAHFLSRNFPPQTGQTSTFDIINNAGFTAQALLIGATILLAPFFEEYLFRGLIYDSIRKRFDTLVAIFLSATVFMAFHLIEYYDYWVGLFAILFLGVFLSILRLRSKSISPPILCHASYNLTILMLV